MDSFQGAAAKGRQRQQQQPRLVLVLRRVARMHGHRGAVHVQLTHDAAAPAGQPAQAQQADEDVLPHVLVAQEGLPA
jgi:hypothetical protein